MTVPDPYARQLFRGVLLDNATIQLLKRAEEILGYVLTIIQGVGGAAASSGTHLGKGGEGGRAFDLAPYDHARKVKVLRDLGCAVWFRAELPGVWGEHIHGVNIFAGRDNRRGIADAAFAQIGKYDRGEDGLADPPTRDPNPYRPDPKTSFTLAEYRASFQTPPTRPTKTPVTRARNRLVEAIHGAGQAAALLETTDDGRVKARAQVDEIRKARRGLVAALEALPKR